MKEIQLTQGYVALVDDEDFERVNQFNWAVDKRKYANYASRDALLLMELQLKCTCTVLF